MAKFTDSIGNIILEIPFPEEKLVSILKKLEMSVNPNFEKMEFEQKRIILLATFREFLNGVVYLEELSEIANQLKMLFDVKTRTKDQLDYEKMIYEAADLSYYLRSIEIPEKSMFAGFLYSLKSYFDTYKHLLDSSSNYSAKSYFENDNSFKPGEKVFISSKK